MLYTTQSTFRIRTRSAFTLMELLVVLSIVAILSLAFVSAMGSIRAGEPIVRAIADIRSLVQRGQAEALSRAARFELLVDFENNSITPLERVPITFFGFEGTPAGKVPLFVSEEMIEEDFIPRRDGKCLRIDAQSVSIPHIDEFNPVSPEDGIALSFDIYPRMQRGEVANVLSRGGEWTLQIRAETRRGCFVTAQIGTTTLESQVPLAAYAWGRVELVMTGEMVRLYVNQIPASSNQGAELDGARTTSIVIGDSAGAHFMMDNLRIEALQVEDAYQLPQGVWLVPPGGRAEDAIQERLYERKLNEEGTTSIAQAASNTELATLPLAGPGTEKSWEKVPVPKKALVFFNHQGRLDLNLHTGPLRLTLASQGESGAAVIRHLRIGVLGVISEERVVNTFREADQVGGVGGAP